MSKRGAQPAIRAAGYARLSVASGDSTSIETQSRGIAAFCKQQGWGYDASIDLYQDVGKSGSKREVKRPAFDELMSKLDQYDRIVVWKLDRFTRRLAELTATIERLEDSDVVLIAIQDNIDTSDPSKRLALAFMGGLAEQEARNTTLRVKDAQKTMALSGRWKGGNRPYGWQSVPRGSGEGMKLVLVPDEAKVLRKAVKLAIAGHGPGPIARTLNESGHVSSKENPWTAQAIKRILRSPLMVGWHAANGIVSKDAKGKPLVAHEPLITESEWNKVKKGLLTRSVVRPQKDGALLSGVLFCGLCGGPMHGASSSTNAGANYRCRNRYALNKTCTGTSIKALPIDQLIGEVVIGYLSQDRSRKLVAKGLTTRSDDERSELMLLRQREANLLARVNRMREERLKGVWDYVGGNDDWSADFSAVTRELTQVSDRIAQLTDKDQLTISIPESWLSAKDVRQLWENSTNIERRLAVSALIERIEVGSSNPEWKHRHLDPSRVRIVRWRVPHDAPGGQKGKRKARK